MMRYILYEGNNDMVALQQEVVLIKSYTGLMKMRYSKRVSISLNLQNNLSSATLPPLLLICFVENAFKHGVSYDQPSFIKVNLRTGLQKSFSPATTVCPISREQAPRHKVKAEWGWPTYGGGLTSSMATITRST